MKKEELLAIGVSQYTKQGNPDRARFFMERVNQVLKDYGEGFAVFIGGTLSSFGGDVGAARHSAREAVTYAGGKDVKIKHVKV